MQLRSQQEGGAEVRFVEHDDEVAEAEQVAADALARVEAGTPAREIAVLFRINAQSEAFEEALAARGVPYVVRGAARFFERPEVKQAVSLLRGSRTQPGRRRPTATTWWPRPGPCSAGMGWTEQAPAGRGNVRDRWESLQAIVSQGRDLLVAKPEAGLTDFVAELDRRAAEQHAPVAEGVTLATLHAAKGLEWDVVFVAGMQDGTMPIVHADGPAAVEEERRLLYVGMTRARSELTVSWSLARNPGGRPSRRPSRFLAGLRPEVGSDRVDATAGGKKSRRRKGVPHCRECGQAACAAPPSARSAGARTARRRTTRSCSSGCASGGSRVPSEEEVPAYVVFTDLTLQAIAEVKPADETGLLRISGIGQSKLTKYGDDVLALVATTRG